MQQIRISVREIIEYVMRSGDIQAVFLSSKRMVDGTKAHQKFQKQSGESYEQEIFITQNVLYEDLDILLTGRIDGVIKGEGEIIIDEIKSTARSLDEIDDGQSIHWAQVLMYGYMYACQNHLTELKVRLTYIELESFQIKQFVQSKTHMELETYFFEVIGKYVNWARILQRFKEGSKESLESLKFPFDGYRRGQKQLMAGVYKTIEEGKLLFSRAPTGIGKTIATLFPAIKALGNDQTEKLFYLTAKNIGKQVALDTLTMLEEKGLILKRVAITAKDKVCLMEERNCNPQYCPYAKGHYDRINRVLEEMYVNHHQFDRETIEKFAILHQVCPYELSLDLATFSDVVICDYNYVFDPTAMLKRFFVEDSGRYTILIDEAHNLVDRARDMYSASLNKEDTLDMKKRVMELDKKLYQYFTKLNQLFIDLRKKCETLKDGCFSEKEMPSDFEELLRAIVNRTEKIYPAHQDWPYMELLLEYYFNAYDFIKKMELYNDKYLTYYEKDGQNVTVKMFCIDPSVNVKSALTNKQGVVFFSATLLPMSYYIRLLGGDEQSYGMILETPFEQDKLCLLVHRGISTKFDLRDQSIEPIIDSIEAIVHMKKGNYMVFFPSYKYMESVYEKYLTLYDPERTEVMIQERALSDVQKEDFLNAFHRERDKTLVAFVVLGGMFGEGIDLTGDKLSGAIIVSLGLPQIGYERDLIKSHFDDTMGNGFEYAYVYPGMNKVMQSAGRVIRTVKDVGVVALLDQRFSNPYYKNLFPTEWSHAKTVHTLTEIDGILSDFWEKKS